MKPNARPRRPQFSSGPCAKRPGWTPAVLDDAVLGRSHRSADGKARLKEVIDRTRAVLRVPDAHRVGIVPGSDTGAVEMALWSLLGERGVDVLAWENFGREWVKDVVGQLSLKDARVIEADYGELPDLGEVDCDRDVVFVWNGTTSGVAVPDGDWIAADRKGLTICDATSAAFAAPLPWEKLDAAAFSWQKVLGGEGGHGMLVLGPRAVERLESHAPDWPLPKIFRLTAGGRLNEAIFSGETINTPSMLCVEDVLDALAWADSVGGLDGLMARTRAMARRLPTGSGRLPGWITSPRRPRPVLRHPSASGSWSPGSRSCRPTSGPPCPDGSRRCWRARTSPTTSRDIAKRLPDCGSGRAPRSTGRTSRR